jgi:kinetochore protein NDC80
MFAALELKSLEAEKANLEKIVTEQNLSADEVIRIRTDYDKLSRHENDFRERLSEQTKEVLSLEVKVANASESADHTVDQYNNLLQSLNLHPPPPQWQDTVLVMDLNLAASDPQDLLSSRDIQSEILPTLKRIADARRADHAALQKEHISIDNALDQLIGEYENLEEEVLNEERQHKALNDQAEELRDVR